MPYTGELIVHTLLGKLDHSLVQNQPNYATVEQVVAIGSENTVRRAPPMMMSTKGNLESNTHSLDIMKEVSQALDDLKIPTERIESSRQKGFTGDIRHDSEHIYICVGTNNWKRVKLESF